MSSSTGWSLSARWKGISYSVRGAGWRVGENDGGVAYADAVSVYAGLRRGELGEAARRCDGGYLGSWLNFAVDQK